MTQFLILKAQAPSEEWMGRSGSKMGSKEVSRGCLPGKARLICIKGGRGRNWRWIWRNQEPGPIYSMWGAGVIPRFLVGAAGYREAPFVGVPTTVRSGLGAVGEEFSVGTRRVRELQDRRSRSSSCYYLFAF